MTTHATMTIAAAGRATAAMSPPVPPVVFRNGQPEPNWVVQSVTRDGRLDQRTAVFKARGDSPPSTGELLIAQPVGLVGGVTRWLPLLIGRVDAASTTRTGRTDERMVQVIDNWSTLLKQPLAAPIEATTLGEALGAWQQRAGVKIECDCVDAATLRMAVPNGRTVSQTLGGALQALLELGDLQVVQHLSWTGGQIARRHVAQPCGAGRPVRISAAQSAAGSAMAALRSRRRMARPTKRIALAAPLRVESTFHLKPAWAADAMDLPDAQYARSTSDEFDAVANVFRLWMLNEDGAFTGGSINLGPAFDLTTLFSDGRPVPPTPLRFGDALTRDPAGRSVGIVVEVSTDTGGTWSRYAGDIRVLHDRAGVVLDDDALDAAWLTAARAGLARLRVTATLTHPQPTEAIRWAGNPFAGPFEVKRIAVGDAFAVRRVSPGSIYHEAVRSGQRSADEVDDRERLGQWLAQKVVEQPTPTAGSIQLSSTGLMLALAPGDRLMHLNREHLGDRDAPQLERVEHDFTQHQTHTTWRTS